MGCCSITGYLPAAAGTRPFHSDGSGAAWAYQYGRRNAVRIHNLLCTSHDGVLPAVIALGETIGVNINRADIVRCHMIGPQKNGKCQAIVKFVQYWKRAEFIRNRRRLKGNDEKTFITEDLTKRNMEVLNALFDLRSNHIINSAWSSDGRLFYKVSADSDPVLVRSINDIPK